MAVSKRPKFLHVVNLNYEDTHYWVNADTRAVHDKDGVWLGSSHRPMRTDLDLQTAIEHWVGMPVDVAPPLMRPGRFYPRVFRPAMPSLNEKSERARDDAVHAARALFRRLEDVFLYIEPRKRNLAAYGHESRGLLLLACNEVETQLKSVLRENGHRRLDGKTNKPVKSNRWNLDSDYIECADLLRLRDWSVRLSGRLDIGTLQPFASWRKGNTPDWWTAYNRVKHDREKDFARATVGACIDALAALVITITAQFGSWTHARPFSPLWATHSASPEQQAMAPFKLMKEPKWTAADFFGPPALVGAKDWTPKGRWS